MSRRPDTCNALVLVLVSVLLWAPRLGGPIDLRWDGSIYYLLGRSLTEGKGYRLLNEPGEAQATQYPPLLPALVAAHQRVLGSTEPAVVAPWLRRSFFVLFLCYVLAVYVLARQYLAGPTAFLVALISTLYLQGIFLSDLLFAELPFALATTLLALFVRRGGGWGNFFLAALAGSAGYLSRTAGIAFLAAWVADALLKRDGKQVALRAVATLIPLIGWQAYTSHVTSGEEYRRPAYSYQRAPYQYSNVSYVENNVLIDPVVPELGRASPADLARRFLANLASMPANIGEGVTKGEKAWELVFQYLGLPPWAAKVPGLLLGCLILAGAAVLLAGGERFIPLAIAASVALTCTIQWPTQVLRYLLPLTPFFALSLVLALIALRASASRCSLARQRAATATAAAVICGVLGTEVATDLHAYTYRRSEARWTDWNGGKGFRLFYYGRSWEDYDAALDWLKGRAGPGAVIITASPHWAYLRTGVKAVMPPMEADPERAQRLLDEFPAAYVIADAVDDYELFQRYAAPAIRGHPGRWRQIYAAPDDGNTRIYQRVD
jgi:hypothetical protein